MGIDDTAGEGPERAVREDEREVSGQ